LALFREVPPAELDGVRQMLEKDVRAPPAHGAGRWFDAVGALALGRPRARYQGQVAMALDAVADDGPVPPYPFAVDRSRTPPELDLRPLARAVVEDLLAGRGAGLVSARFHAALAAGAAALVELAAERAGRLPVVLSGGVFQNARLAEALVGRLAGRHAVHLHAVVPPGDGGIALGQAMIADAAGRR
jgi:hydrogenase maturation protein HypF